MVYKTPEALSRTLETLESNTVNNACYSSGSGVGGAKCSSDLNQQQYGRMTLSSFLDQELVLVRKVYTEGGNLFGSGKECSICMRLPNRGGRV